jgi:hypothetical protein
MHVLHRLGDNHESVRQHFFLNRVFRLSHQFSWKLGAKFSHAHAAKSLAARRGVSIQILASKVRKTDFCGNLVAAVATTKTVTFRSCALHQFLVRR